MSKHNSEFIEHIKDMLEPIGPLAFRPMFSAFGVYKNGKIFALIHDNELYFKADANIGEIFANQGSEQFSYQAKDGRIIKICYWRVPAEILEDSEHLQQWFALSYSVACIPIKKSKKQK